MSRVPPSRRSNRLKPSGGLEVVSINKFELYRQEHAMDQAVIQLEALKQGRAYAEMMMQFGGLNVRDDAPPRPFDFDVPAACQTWPGPPFNSFGLHKEKHALKSKPRLKSSEKKHSRMEEANMKLSEATIYRHKPMAATAARAPPATASASSRSPPLRLMDLPTEVRNEIWTLLVVFNKPIEAQLRHIKLRPYSQGNSVIRRFPREPPISAVSKQLRNDVLSLFYGMNRFTFARSTPRVLKAIDMTSASMMQAWKPRADVVQFLAHLEICLSIRHREVTFVIKRMNTALAVEVRMAPAICWCADRSIALRASKCTGDLVEVAMELVYEQINPIYGPGLSLDGLCQECGRSLVE